jgi:hypothetical protein
MEATYTVLSKDSGIAIHPQGEAGTPLQPFAKDTFVGSLVGIMRFSRDARGAVTGFTVNRYNVRGVRFDHMKQTA